MGKKVVAHCSCSIPLLLIAANSLLKVFSSSSCLLLASAISFKYSDLTIINSFFLGTATLKLIRLSRLCEVQHQCPQQNNLANKHFPCIGAKGKGLYKTRIIRAAFISYKMSQFPIIMKHLFNMKSTACA